MAASVLERHDEELSAEDLEDLAEQMSYANTEKFKMTAMPVRTLAVKSL
jgi:hypothetical protein